MRKVIEFDQRCKGDLERQYEIIKFLENFHLRKSVIIEGHGDFQAHIYENILHFVCYENQAGVL